MTASLQPLDSLPAAAARDLRVVMTDIDDTLTTHGRLVPAADIDRIVAMFHEAGATAKVSSIHVNGWFGRFDKRTTALAMLGRHFALSDAAILARCAFIGDSPNDAPMFAHFPLSVGVANV